MPLDPRQVASARCAVGADDDTDNIGCVLVRQDNFDALVDSVAEFDGEDKLHRILVAVWGGDLEHALVIGWRWLDLNQRPLTYQISALTGLSYTSAITLLRLRK